MKHFFKILLLIIITFPQKKLKEREKAEEAPEDGNVLVNLLSVTVIAVKK